ncbi:unnamed protein product, partial [marine sediment metagenome]
VAFIKSKITRIVLPNTTNNPQVDFRAIGDVGLKSLAGEGPSKPAIALLETTKTTR